MDGYAWQVNPRGPADWTARDGALSLTFAIRRDVLTKAALSGTGRSVILATPMPSR